MDKPVDGYGRNMRKTQTRNSLKVVDIRDGNTGEEEWGRRQLLFIISPLVLFNFYLHECIISVNILKC